MHNTQHAPKKRPACTVDNVWFSQAEASADQGVGKVKYTLHGNIQQVNNSGQCLAKPCSLQQIQKILAPNKGDFLTIEVVDEDASIIHGAGRDHLLSCDDGRLCMLKQLKAMGLFDGVLKCKEVKAGCSHDMDPAGASIKIRKHWFPAGPPNFYPTCPTKDPYTKQFEGDGK